MSRCKRLVGFAAIGVVVSGVAAMAQDAVAPPAAPTTQQQQPATQDCSGLGCLFGSRSPAPPPPPVPPQPADQAAADPAGQPAAAPAEAAPPSTADASPPAAQDPAPATEVKRRRVARPVHVVTIAADGPEAARLQRLADALPKEKIKIVTSRREGDRAGSDFSISAALSPSRRPAATKLFTEQMHIVAGGAVRSIADLQDKVVSFGPDKSPSQAAARKAFEALNVHVKETPLDVDNALDGLTTGDVDAVVMLAPQPIDRLKTFSGPGVHLVSWPEGGMLPDGATAATIDAGAYPSLARPGQTIRAMGVDAMLTISPKAARQGAAKTFLKALAQHSDVLTKRGFDLLKADLESRNGRHLASADRLQ